MSVEDTVIFNNILSSNGYRVTRPRISLFNLLISAEPQSIAQILAKASFKIDRVSVYRNIELFERLGIVHRIYVGWKYKLELSDLFVEHHHHMSCIVCGKVIDIDDEIHIDQFIEKVSAKFEFTPRRHLFEVDGYCKGCKNKANA